MLDTGQAGEDTDGSVRAMRRLLTDATTTLEQLQVDLRSARGAGGPGVDWPRLLARVEVANRRLQQMIALLEGHQS
jgi:hypothetical protein